MTAAPNNSMQLEGKTILLGITGGIAAYKSCNIVSLLQKRGARVKVVMSEHATEFVGPLTFRALTGEPVAVGHDILLFSPSHRARLVTKLRIPPVLLSPGNQFCTVEYFTSASLWMMTSTTAACS